MDLVSSDPSEMGRAYRRVGMDLRPAPLQEAAGGPMSRAGGYRRGAKRWAEGEVGARFGGA